MPTLSKSLEFLSQRKVEFETARLGRRTPSWHGSIIGDLSDVIVAVPKERRKFLERARQWADRGRRLRRLVDEGPVERSRFSSTDFVGGFASSTDSSVWRIRPQKGTFSPPS
jgi:hypothetical protein